jgi:hypothetical protein
MTRSHLKGHPVVLPIPHNRAECLSNRQKLGYNIKTQGGGVCDQLFPAGAGGKSR